MNMDFVTQVASATESAEILELLRSYEPHCAFTADLLAWAFGQETEAFVHPLMTQIDRLYVEAMVRHKHHQRGVRNRETTFHVGREYDPIGSMDLIDHWPISKFICFLLARRNQPIWRCAAVVGMRDEGVSALEWVAHYQAIGIDHIFVYTNGNRDGSEAILDILAKWGEITLIYNEIGGDTHPQMKIYEHFLLMLPASRDFEWCCFFDSDEFFVPDRSMGHDVKHLLNVPALADKSIAAIWYPWRWIVSDGIFQREAGLLAERFRYGEKHVLVKSIARIANIVSLKPIHSPYILTTCRPVDGALEPRSMLQLFDKVDWPEDTGVLYHYWCKSFEEFFLKKSRGDTIEISENDYSRNYEQFFEWNARNHSRPYCAMSDEVISIVRKELSRLSALPQMSNVLVKIQETFRDLVTIDRSGRPLFSVFQEVRIAKW